MKISHSETNTIQQVLSKLIINPRCLIRCLGSPKTFLNEIDISNNCREILYDFFEKESHQILASALFLARKRFLAIIESLYIYKKIKSMDELDILWNKYLSSFKYDDRAPKNPIYEVINFCNYIKVNENNSKLENLILEYEIAKHQVILNYNLWPNSYGVARDHINKNEIINIEEQYLFIHPCAKIIEFSGNITEVVHAITKSALTTDLIFKEKNEKLIFYKNFNNGMFTTISANKTILLLMDVIKQNITIKNMHEACEKENIFTDFNAFVDTIKKLVQIGIFIVICKQKKDEYFVL